MNDTNEPRDDVAASYDRLRASVEPTVAVEPALDDLHSATSRRSMPRAWSVAAVGLSAAAVLAVAFLVVTGPDEQPTASPGQTPSTAAPAAVEPAEDGPCSVPQIVVYVEPAATPEVVDGVRRQLAVIDPGGEWSYLDVDGTLAEFRRLFAAPPDFVDGIRPEELPTSFRREVSGELPSMDLETMDEIPGTLRVEATEEYAAIACGGGATPSPSDEAGATTTSSAPADGPTG